MGERGESGEREDRKERRRKREREERERGEREKRERGKRRGDQYNAHITLNYYFENVIPVDESATLLPGLQMGISPW